MKGETSVPRLRPPAASCARDKLHPQNPACGRQAAESVDFPAYALRASAGSGWRLEAGHAPDGPPTPWLPPSPRLPPSLKLRRTGRRTGRRVKLFQNLSGRNAPKGYPVPGTKYLAEGTSAIRKPGPQGNKRVPRLRPAPKGRGGTSLGMTAPAARGDRPFDSAQDKQECLSHCEWRGLPTNPHQRRAGSAGLAGEDS